MTALLSPVDEVLALAAKNADAFADCANALIAARARKDGTAYQAAMAEAAALFGRVMAFADLLGRRRMQMLADRAEHDAETRAQLVALSLAKLKTETPILPRVEFKEAVADVLERRPELAVGWRAVADVYMQRHGFACARAMDVEVTKRVQDVLARTVRDGSVASPRKVIAELGDFAQSYANTVYQNTVQTAYAAGMWSRMADPAVARVLLGCKFVSALLPTSRPNHTAAHGLIAPTESLLWNVFGGILGHNCHCSRREVSIFEAQRMGWLDERGNLRTILPPRFAEAGPDPGFGLNRPDRAAAQGTLL